MVREINNLVKIAKESGIKNFYFKGKSIKISFSFIQNHETHIQEEIKENIEEIIEEEPQQLEVEVKSEFIGILSLEKKSNISVGVDVKKDQIIAYVESLGVKHEIKSPIDGKIKEVLPDGSVVDYGKVICKIMP